MAVLISPKRFFLFLCNSFRRNSKFQITSGTENPKNQIRTLYKRTNHQKNALPVFYKINLANFYNSSKPLFNVSTYENLVNKQSSSAGAENKKCSESSQSKNPGRHKFHQEIEAFINDQIEMEFNASFAYLSMASYYGRTEVALPGCQGYFMMMHQEEHEHGIILLNYTLMRGGSVKIPCICPPGDVDWKDISKTFAVAVEMECQVKEKLDILVELAEKHRDHQLVDFISAGFLKEQNKSIQIMARLLARSKMVKNDVGEYLFDQHLYESFVKHSKDNLMYYDNLPAEEDKKNYK